VLKVLLLVLFYILFGPIVLLAIPIYLILWVLLRPFRAGADRSPISQERHPVPVQARSAIVS
jgi:hypothetical protein